MIHIGEPRTLFDYSQESGRAGRDRKISQVIVIRDRIKGQSHKKSYIGVNRQLVERYLDAAYKRVVLDRYLDSRKDREGCESGEERCEGCGIEAEAEDENTETINDITASRSRSPPTTVHQLPVSYPSPRANRIIPIAANTTIVARHQQEVGESQGKIGKIRE